MKTFNDLLFKPHPIGMGKISTMEFDNGWGVSVVQSTYSYGGSEGLYELAVTKGGSLHYDNPVAYGDVVGYLTEEDVTKHMGEIQMFTNGSEISDYSN
jgi:hypothetical protein